VKPCAFLLAALAGLGAWADPSPFTLTTTVDLLYQRNLTAISPSNGQKCPGQYQDALSLVGNDGPWTGGLTLRDIDFYQQTSSFTLDRATTTLYKKYLKFDAGHWNLQAGDFNTMLGRGLLLSVIQNPTILKQDTIMGGDARWRAGALELHALAGTVTTEQRNQSWRVAGGEAALTFLPEQRLGLRAVTIQDGRPSSVGTPVGLRQGHSFSLAGQDLLGCIGYYGELGHIDYRDQQLPWWPVPVDPRKGDGSYGSLSFHHQAWFLMAEGKHYENFDNALNNPPLADRDTEKNDVTDASGQRLYAQYSFKDPDLTLFFSAGRYRQEADVGHNIYGGFKLQDGFDRLDLSWTYGLKTVLGAEKKTDAALTWRFTPVWSLDLTLRDKRNRLNGSAPYEETDLTVQLARSPRFSVYLLQQRSSVAIFNATRMYSAEARVNFHQGSYVDLSGGRLRGGEVCAGGQCVNLPPFKGWKLAAHLRW
jgi:hypothetical protein